jgi:hypothetical protein
VAVLSTPPPREQRVGSGAAEVTAVTRRYSSPACRTPAVTRATGTAFDVWNRWDARWYDDLARLGYNLHGPNDDKNVGFFPLYPLLVRMLHDGLALVGRDVLDGPVPDRRMGRMTVVRQKLPRIVVRGPPGAVA